MFPSVASLVSLVLAASAVVAAPTYRRTDIPDRADWKNQGLESYYRFRTRYKNLGCADIQGTDFYSQCCLPLPQGQSPAEQCTPSWCSAPATSSTVSVEAPATSSAPVITTSVEPVDAPAVSSTTLASPPASSAPVPTPVQDEGSDDEGDDDDDDYDWVCDDDDETTSIAPTTTDAPAPAPTEVDDGDEDDGDYDDDEDDEDLPYCDEVGDDYEPITVTTSAAPPPPTSTPAPEPEPTTTEQAPPPPPTTTAEADNNNHDIQSGGFATFYYQNGNAGACGEYSSDWDLIGAIDQDRYGYNFGVVSSECGRRVRITNKNNGKTVDITIKDVCPTCNNGNSIDLSKGAFLAIASESEGMVPIDWYYL